MEYARNKKMLEFLVWLSQVCVYLVWTELGMVGEQKETDLPHIRWIGAGILSRDPFDAAGNHSLGSRDNMMSEATLSYVRLPYIPNIRSLSYSREGRRREYLNQKPDSRVSL